LIEKAISSYISKLSWKAMVNGEGDGSAVDGTDGEMDEEKLSPR
jgi:hypothetical protein